MRLRDICRISDIFCPERLGDTEITGVSADSRRVREGYAFVCLRGTRSDGNSHINDALLHGARVIVSERDDIVPDITVRVADAHAAIAKMMNALCGCPAERLKFIAVTGTNGKTSVSFILKHIFDTLNIPCELIGTLNSSSFSARRGLAESNFTTPDPEELYPMLQRIADAGIGTVVMEASSHALDQRRLEPIRFEVGVFTGLSEDHLDYHGTMERYYLSKLSLFGHCRLGVINADDIYGKRVLRDAKCRCISCSRQGRADHIATQAVCSADGISYVLGGRYGACSVESPLCGEFQIMNTLQAAAVAIELGLDPHKVAEAIGTVKGISGRLEALNIPRELGFSVYIDYAHTPDALERALRSVRSIRTTEGGRIITVFGCGGDRERQKRPLMGRIAMQGSDLCIITADNPRTEDPRRIIEDILEGTEGFEMPCVIPDRKNAIRFAIATARENDIILLAGKGHEKYQIDASGVHPFDEGEIVRTAIEKIYGRRK